MKKKLLMILTVVLLFGILLPVATFAVSGNEPSYTYWMEDSKDYTNTTYGKWVNKKNPVHGPGTMTKTYEDSTSVSVSGGIPKSSLSVGLTKGKSISTGTSRDIPKGKKGRFQVRNVYKHYKVNMEEWISVDGRKSKTGKTKTVKAKKKDEMESRIILQNAK